MAEVCIWEKRYRELERTIEQIIVFAATHEGRAAARTQPRVVQSAAADHFEHGSPSVVRMGDWQTASAMHGVDARDGVSVEELHFVVPIDPLAVGVRVSVATRTRRPGTPYQALISFGFEDNDGRKLMGVGAPGSTLVSVSPQFGTYSYLDSTRQDALTAVELVIPEGAVSMRVSGHDWKGVDAVRVAEAPRFCFVFRERQE